MSVVHILDTLSEWAKVNICDKVSLKAPPPNEMPDDSAYDYKLVNPSVFTLYVPTSEKLPPNIHSPFPSLCVRFMEGENGLSSGKGFINVQFVFSAWDPGTHGKDRLAFISVKNNIWQDNGGAETFERNGDGWRDVWNFVDVALRAVESVTNIGGYVIDHQTPIKFGPLGEQESIPDFYPFWFAWISFRVNYPLMRNVEDFQNHL